jgi:hypothetical protein
MKNSTDCTVCLLHQERDAKHSKVNEELVQMFHWESSGDDATSVLDDRMIVHKECVMVGTALWWPRIVVVFYKTAMNVPAPKSGVS